MHPKARAIHPRTNRIYVSVNSDFDATGHICPRSITWTDGRVFPIERIQDFRPASTVGLNLAGDCFTVVIHGRQRHLFFEHTDGRFCDRLGRWFVEAKTP